MAKQLQIDHRLFRSPLKTDKQGKHRGACDQGCRDLRRRYITLEHRFGAVDQQQYGDDQQQRMGQIQFLLRSPRLSRNQPDGERNYHHDKRDVNEKNRPPVIMFQYGTANQRAKRGATGTDGGPDAQRNIAIARFNKQCPDPGKRCRDYHGCPDGQ